MFKRKDLLWGLALFILIFGFLGLNLGRNNAAARTSQSAFNLISSAWYLPLVMGEKEGPAVTPGPSATPPATSTTATNTPASSITPSSTATTLPPSATHTPSSMPSGTPTSTPEPGATSTPTPTPTNTPGPVTSTPPSTATSTPGPASSPTPLPTDAPFHFSDCAFRTGNNATIAVKTSVQTINFTLEINDEIAVFSANGTICGGVERWTGDPIVITAWGDDSQSGGVDGLTAGETMAYKVWKSAAQIELEVDSATYSMGDGKYSADSIHIIESITAVNE